MSEEAKSSYMKSMFFGEIREDLIFPYPHMDADNNENVSMILDTLTKFESEHIRSKEWDEKGEMPREVVQQLAELGIMGMVVPEELGGLGLPNSGYARIMQQLPVMDASLTVTLGAHQSIGYKALLLFGNDEQKKKYLPRLASGELIAAYCLTEPSSGSDAASIQTTATLAPDGKHYIIKGNKLWITNGAIASFLTVFAKTEVVEKGEKKQKVSCFIVELPADGVSVGPHEDKLGIRASWTNAIHFDDVKVPVENLIGEVGKGFKVAMGVLNHGRLGLAAGCIGMGRACIKAASEHANERVQFQKKLREFGMIQEKIGRLTAHLYAAESMVYMTTSLIDRGDVDYSLESAIVKVFASEMVWEAVDENIQIWGGAGFMKEYPYERWLRDARIYRIFEGTNEILRAFIALSGMQAPGQELAQLSDVIRYPLKGLGLVTEFAKRNIRTRVWRPSIEKADPKVKRLAAVLEEHSGRFSNQIQTLIFRHRKKIFLRQFAQKRVANIAIDLYAISCVLSRVTRAIQSAKDEESVKLELSIAEAFFQAADMRIRDNFAQIDRNNDAEIKYIANSVMDLGDYPFDFLKIGKSSN